MERTESTRSTSISLPDEILAIIFIYACPSNKFQSRFSCARALDTIDYHRSYEWEGLQYCTLPIILSSVSSQWRRVSWSTPQLWRTLAVRVTNGAAEQVASLLCLYLQNSGNHPVSLELDFRQEPTMKVDRPRTPRSHTGVFTPYDTDPIKNVLFGNRGWNISVLRLIAPPIEWFSLLGRLQRLEFLLFGWPEEGANNPSPIDPAFGNLPCLRHLTIKGVWPDIETQPEAITTLDLESVPIDVCVALLIRCPYLTEYHARRPLHSPHQSQHSVWLTTPISLPRLRIFYWTSTAHALGTALLNYLQLPTLERLGWSGSHHSEARPAFQQFFARLPSSLRYLELVGFRSLGRAGLLVDIFHDTPQVSHLTLYKCDTTFLSSAITALAICNTHEDGANLLPKLRFLACRKVPDAEACPEILCEFFWTIVADRMKNRVGEEFLLEADQQLFDWQPYVRKRLRELTGRGIKLRIVEGSKEVDWLTCPGSANLCDGASYIEAEHPRVQ